MIKNILFDLDGTLLPMDQDYFVKLYIYSLHEAFPSYHKDVKELAEVIMKGTYLMVNNDGSKTNERVFYDFFKDIHGDNIDKLIKNYEEYYNHQFAKAKEAINPSQYANLLIKELKKKGYNLILATNPLFPRVATLNRIKWAGLDPNDFTLITTYENSSYCKPNLKYYEEIISKLNLNKDECIMVGNDTREDYIITKLGIPCIILKDCLINKDNLELDFTTLKDLYEASKNYPYIK